MKGIVFNLLEEVVVNELGADKWDELLDAAGVDGIYTSLGNYPDAEVVKLVAAGAAALSISEAEVLRWFGRKAMPLLVQRYPVFFTHHKNTRNFVLTLNTVIHHEVEKLYPGSSPPPFEFDMSREDLLVMHYRSHRRLCHLAHGFIEGAGDYYGETVECEQLVCMHSGAQLCTFHLTFRPKAH